MSQSIIVTDLSYGDAGKGTTVDYLARQADDVTVIRHNGGPQAAHNVITPDGRHHTFAQFGSGSFMPGVRTHLSRFMLVNPHNMLAEAEHLVALGEQDVWPRTTVDREALLITPWHVAANRLRELARGDGRHGSCAQGIGETMAFSLAHPELTLTIGDIESAGLRRKLQAVRHQLRAELSDLIVPGDEQRLLDDAMLADTLVGAYRHWASLVQLTDRMYLSSQTHRRFVFEGAQGVLLDEWFGFDPYTTWSTTTSANALTLLDEIDYDGEVTRLGVLRAHTTRHGPGPLVTEDSAIGERLLEPHNGTGQWQGAFRQGHLDLVAHRYAVRVNGGVDELVVTGLDKAPEWRVCARYEFDDVPSERLAAYFVSNGKGGYMDIRPGMQGDLEYQALLTRLLFRAHPCYEPGRLDSAELVAYIAQQLGAPVTLASYGPTASDKRALAVR